MPHRRSYPFLRSAGLIFTLGLSIASIAQSAAELIAQGDSLLRLDRPQKALGYYDKAVELAPVSSSYTARARALYMLEHMDSFLLDVERALRLDSTNSEAHYQRALYAFRAQDPQRTEEHCDRALRHGAADPLRGQVLVLRGEARADLGRHPQAIEDLQQGLGSASTNTTALTALARSLDLTDRHEEALQVLKRLCELEPTDVGHWTNQGFELAKLDRHAEALTIYDKALQLDRDEPVALSDRAWSLMALGREDEAMKDVERSLRFYPSNAFALRTRGLLRLRKGDREKGCSDLNLARIIGGVDGVEAAIKEHCGEVAPRSSGR